MKTKYTLPFSTVLLNESCSCTCFVVSFHWQNGQVYCPILWLLCELWVLFIVWWPCFRGNCLWSLYGCITLCLQRCAAADSRSHSRSRFNTMAAYNYLSSRVSLVPVRALWRDNGFCNRHSSRRNHHVILSIQSNRKFEAGKFSITFFLAYGGLSKVALFGLGECRQTKPKSVI